MAVDLSTSGGSEFAKGYPGQIADLSASVTISRHNEESSTIPFGRVAARGAAGGCRLMDGSHYAVAGIVTMAPMRPLVAGVSGVKQYDHASLLVEGPVFVTAAEDGRDGDQVVALSADGGTIGFSKGGPADESTRVTVPGAMLVGDVTAGQICKIHLRGSGRTIRATS